MADAEQRASGGAPAPRIREADWDLTSWFPEFRGAAYLAFREALRRDLAALREDAERLPGAGGPVPAETAPSTPAPPASAAPGRPRATPAAAPEPEALARLLVRLEEVHARAQHLAAYLGCLAAAHAGDEEIEAELASAAADRAPLEALFARVRWLLGALPEEHFEKLALHPELDGATYFLRRMREAAARSMPPELEGLAAELGVTGIGAFGRLYDRLTGTLEFELEVPGRPARRLPVAAVRTLLEDPDPAVRRAAKEGSNRAFASLAPVFAACLNNIAGTRLTLCRRRGIPDVLDQALFDQAIGRETLEALLGAVRERAEVARRFLRRKAALLGLRRLGFEDRLAPLPVGAGAHFGYAEACERVERAFGSVSRELADFAAHAFRRRHVDHGVRPRKRPGAFCSTSILARESRVFLSFGGSLLDVSTLAHELGHAFHGWVMRELRPFARRYPMTLAETASTFAERVLCDALLRDPETPEADRLNLLDARMRDAATFLLDIPARFAFEEALHRERAGGELGVPRLCELMSEAERESFGDALDPERLDPWFWASKLHFFLPGLAFYNFPYTFGWLLALGIYERVRTGGAEAFERYLELLRRTGSGPAAEVVATTLGEDLSKPEFWYRSLDLVERDHAAWEEATRAGLAGSASAGVGSGTGREES